MEKFDSPFNKISNHVGLFTEEGNEILKKLHVIDCECYRIKGKLFYREVAVFNMDKVVFLLKQCYAENTLPYNGLDDKSKATI